MICTFFHRFQHAAIEGKKSGNQVNKFSIIKDTKCIHIYRERERSALDQKWSKKYILHQNANGCDFLIYYI